MWYDVIQKSGDILLYVFAFIIALLMIAQFRMGFDNIPDVPTEAKDAVDKIDDTAYRWIDYGTLVLAIGLMVVMCIQAYISFKNPIMSFIVVIALFTLPFISMMIANIYGGLVGSSVDIATLDAKMPYTHLIMSNLGIVCLIYVVLIGIFYFIKPSESMQ
jgi:fumarate reductase subunit C